MPYDPADLAARVRALAAGAHRALKDSRPDPARLREVAAQAAGLKGQLDHSPSCALGRWLEAVRSQAEALAAAHSHAERFRAESPVAA